MGHPIVVCVEQALTGEEVFDAAGEFGLRRGDHARRDFF
jgi:hypothetical protein